MTLNMKRFIMTHYWAFSELRDVIFGAATFEKEVFTDKEIRDLKQELAMHDSLASKGSYKAKTDPYTAEEAYKM